MSDDTELLRSARTGDEAALETLLRRHQSRILRFAMKMCRDGEDAKDVLQETLFAMARGLREFRGASSVSTWLYSIARSFCVKKRRKSAFALVAEVSLETEAGEPALALPDPGRGPEELLHQKRVEEALEEAIGALEPHYREVLVLRDVEGLTAPEVAEVMGLGVEAVKSRLHRARAEVRRRLQPLLAPVAAVETGPCPDIVELFSRHQEGEISGDLCAEMERHLVSCPRCRQSCDALKQSLRLCQALPAPAVPQDVQDAIRAGIRGLLAGRER